MTGSIESHKAHLPFQLRRLGQEELLDQEQCMYGWQDKSDKHSDKLRNCKQKSIDQDMSHPYQLMDNLSDLSQQVS